MALYRKGEEKAKLSLSKLAIFARKNWEVHKVKQKSYMLIVWDPEQMEKKGSLKSLLLI